MYFQDTVRNKEEFFEKVSKSLCKIDEISREIRIYEAGSQGNSKKCTSEIQADKKKNKVAEHECEKDVCVDITNKLKSIFSAALFRDEKEIRENDDLEKYAIDSFKIVEITSNINMEFNNIPSTLLFEHRTIKSIATFIKSTLPQADPIDACEVSRGKGRKETGQNEEACGQSHDGKIQIDSHTTENSTEFLERNDNDIAIIGINGKFPGADTIQELWEILVSGREVIKDIPSERWDWQEFWDSKGETENKSYSKWGGFLEEIESFDAKLFNISPREAEMMDPQHRLFMETVWGLLEDAGYSPFHAERNTGVFVGLVSNDYSFYTSKAAMKGMGAYRNTDYYQLSNRISYFFDFNGPSISVDTACSSSGTAVHLACESIKRNECRVAVVGGVNLILHPSRYIQYSRMGIMSPSGICKPFGDDADGTVFGEGIAALLLKPLLAAEEDGDHIYGIIKGTGINSGGKTNGFNVPNPQAQGKLISDIVYKTGIDPETISYIETHGTGTSLGDPIEIRGLKIGLNKNGTVEEHATEKTAVCSIGSLKANIGHLESAAAITGIIKVVLQMNHRLLVPSLHSTKLNPMIEFAQTRFFVQQKLEPWKRTTLKKDGKDFEYPYRAGVSAFGAGGSNSHILVEEYRGLKHKEGKKTGKINIDEYIIVISAQSESQLQLYAQRLLSFLNKENEGKRKIIPSHLEDEICIENIAYTLQVGRAYLEERLAVVVKDKEELKDRLASYLNAKNDKKSIFRGNTKTNSEFHETILDEWDVDLLLGKWIERKKYTKIANLWTKGVDIPWHKLYDHVPKRISLPQYPFEKRKFWVPKEITNKDKIPESHSLDDPKVLFLKDHWEICPLNTRFEVAQIVKTIDGIIVIEESDMVHLSFQKIKDFYPSLALKIKPGDQYRFGNQQAEIRLSRREDFEHLMKNTDVSKVRSLLVVLSLSEYFISEIDLVNETLKRTIYALTTIVQTLMRINDLGEIHIVNLIEDREEDLIRYPLFTAISAFMKTVKLENPKFHFRNILLKKWKETNASIGKMILSEIENTVGNDTVYYNNGQRYERKIVHLEKEQLLFQTSGTILKSDGVYLITGGTGGIGIKFAQYIAKKVNGTVILTGRSDLNSNIQSRINRIDQSENQIVYIKADIANPTDVKKLIQAITDRYHGLNGIFHLAGVIQDAYVINKKKQEIETVLGPKVYGAINLDSFTRQLNLDFFILFSSTAGLFGGVGQCDYAFANRFMDFFAESRENLRKFSKRSGKTISINWPYWKDGGMKISPQEFHSNYRSMGMEPMPTEEGIQAWERIFGNNGTNWAVIYGQRTKILNGYLKPEQAQKRNKPTDEKPIDPDLDGNELHAVVESYLKNMFGEIFKLPPDEIESEERFDIYGLDSIMINRFNNKIEKTFGGQISKTLLFEYQNIHELVDYFVKQHKIKISQIPGCAQRTLSFQSVRSEIPEKTLEYFSADSAQNNKDVSVGLENIQSTESPMIAVIGMSGRFPQATNIMEYWKNISTGKDSVIEVPKSRWDSDLFYDSDPAKHQDGKMYCKWIGFLEDADKFDPLFFNISPLEAECMDPQERIFIEMVWEAIEDAGYTIKRFRNSVEADNDANIGVFAANTSNTYLLNGPEEWRKGNWAIPNSLPWSLANRVSYLFDFQGISIPIDTACSSSLTAIHMAKKSLLDDECSIAIVGGINLYLHPSKFIRMCGLGMLSPTGKCHTFGSQADGMVVGEGGGVVILKKIERALKDRDHIYAVIRGSSVNHDGRTNGYTVPNPRAQGKLIENAWKDAGIDPRTATYIEAHGTGTPLGDTVEIDGLKRIFKKGEGQYCAIGSVKTNIGHLESAAGIAGLIKVILQMQFKKIVPSLNAAILNPKIDLTDSPFYIPKKMMKWDRIISSEEGFEKKYPRRAGISSFGAGGSNAHIVVEEFEHSRAKGPSTKIVFPSIIVLSAENHDILKKYIQGLIAYLEDENNNFDQLNIELSDIAYTLQVGRQAMEERFATVVKDKKDLLNILYQVCRDEGKNGNWFCGLCKKSKWNAKSAQNHLTGHPSITQLIQSNQLEKLAELWVQGADIDWELLYLEEKPIPVSLPTYPFQRERYWIPQKTENGKSDRSDAVNKEAATAGKTNEAGMIYASKSADFEERLKEKTDRFLQNLIGNIIKVTPQKIDPYKRFEKYGIDSIIIVRFNAAINEKIGHLPKTLLFEHKTIDTLSHYLISNYRMELLKLYQMEEYEGFCSPDSTKNRSEISTAISSENYLNILDNHAASLGKEFYDNNDPEIAIIGLAGKYPMAETLEDFWENIKNGRDCIQEVPISRWDSEKYFSGGKDRQNGIYCKWGGFIDDYDKFDSLFFNISPKEASFMDPQERVFLETAWSCVEDAGYNKKNLNRSAAGKKTVGVFAGVTFNTYQLYQDNEWKNGNLIPVNSQIFSISNRVSYVFDLNGPSLTIDTACSSSLSAIHVACESIKRGECEMAIAGGVNLTIHPSKYYTLCAGEFAARDGRCRSFGYGGTGYVPGEGAGALLLKTAEQAISDHDHIYGIIKATSINHDGKTNGYTVPSPDAQAKLILNALKKARIDSRTVSYIEAHGTGTPLGDPIEIQGLTQAFRKYGGEEQHCAIGSVKSNIGHLESAAGIAGVTKIILQMKYGQLVPTLHTEKLNPHIDFHDTPFYVQKELTEWKKTSVTMGDRKSPCPRRAGVSSFGAGGANAHVIIEEFEQPKYHYKNSSTGPFIFILSAKTKDRLVYLAGKMKDFLKNNRNDTDKGQAERLIDYTYTLQVGREALNERLAIVIETYDEIEEKLNAFVKGQTDIDGVYLGSLTRNKHKFDILNHDIDASEIINRWIEKGKIYKIAELWVDGVDIDWEYFYQKYKPGRISMPTYPFEREKHWVLKNKAKGGVTPQKQTAFSKEWPQNQESGTFYFYPAWQKKEITPDLNSGRSQPENRLIVFSDQKSDQRSDQKDESEKRRDIHSFENYNFKNVFHIRGGKKYLKNGDLDYIIDKENHNDYIELVKTLKESKQLPETVVFISQDMEKRDFSRNGQNLLDSRIKKIILPVFYTIKAFSETKSKMPKAILFVNISKREPIDPVADSVAGYSKSLNIIFPSLTFKIIHIVNAQTDVVDLPGIVKKEIDTLSYENVTEVLYKNQDRLVKTILPVEIKDRENDSIIKKNGVYLITGGAGALGMIFAEYLVKKYSANCILLGRSELDSQKSLWVNELNKTGSEVIYLQANVSDLEEMQDAVKKIKSKFDCINGVIHAAGATSENLIIQKTLQEFTLTFKPKVNGTEVLDKVTSEENLDFFCMFSSNSTILGDFGQCDYAIANRYMDAYAKIREKRCSKGECKGRSIVINWPLWKDGGMHLTAEGEKLYLQSSGLTYIEKNDGIVSFENILKNPKDQILVMSGNKARIMQIFNPEKETNTSSFAGKGKEERPYQSISDKTLPLQKRVRLDIQQMAADILNLDANRMDPYENLGNFGFDSISLKQYAVDLSNAFQVDIFPTLFYEKSDINSISDYLNSTYPDGIKDFYQTEFGPVDNTENEHGESGQIDGANFSHNYLRYEKPNEKKQTVNKDIAVIGISGRFPQSRNLQEFWDNLVSQKDMVTEVPEDRWDWRTYYSKSGGEYKTRSKWGGFVSDIDKFDCMFFKISPIEAEMMDPQQRMLMEIVWETIEDAGYNTSSLEKKAVGHFVGVQHNDYLSLLENAGEQNLQMVLGNSHAILANRISYFLNIHGPSESIETACSASLVAVHRAVKAIQNNECEMAIASGVSLILSPMNVVNADQIGILSPTGRCRTFDENADGYVKGEGVAAILLKPLQDAIDDRDNIYAVVKGSAVNHGGRANSLTAPNSEAQSELLIKAYTEAGIEPESIGYIETHGTGTELGDPVEIEGIKRAFGNMSLHTGRAVRQTKYCGIGSIKTNIGHLEPAAGIAGVIKIILAMKHRILPGTLNLHKLNPYLKIEETPFYIVDQTKTWEPLETRNGKPYPRRAGVSAFGFGGTNAHVVLEEYQRRKTPEICLDDQKQVFVLSAKNVDRLREYAKRMLHFLEDLKGSGAFVQDNGGYALVIEQDLLETASGLLNIAKEEMSLDGNIFEYGLDPTSFGCLIERINTKYNLEIPVSIMSQHESFRLLAAYLSNHLLKWEKEENTDTTTCGTIPLLTDLTYTLQVGRNPMEERLAIIVSSITELREKLSDYCKGKNQIPGIFQGSIKKEKNRTNPPSADRYGKKYLEEIIQLRDVSKIAKAWVNGGNIEWDRIYTTSPHRVSLPTYPFARDRYWYSDLDRSETVKSSSGISSFLHPLLHQNTSVLSLQRFSTRFTGKEFFLTRDSVADSRWTIPAMAFLEMARAALIHATDESQRTSQMICFKNVIWASQDFSGNREKSLHIELFPENNRQTAYEIYSKPSAPEVKPLIYNQGRILFRGISEAPKLNLPQLRAECSQEVLSGNECYELLQKNGIDHGSEYRMLVKAYIGPDRVLAELSLPSILVDSNKQFVLHPCLMNSAFQASIVLLNQSEDRRQYRPYYLNQLDIFENEPAVQWALIRGNPENVSSGKMDVDLCDEKGRVCIRMTGLVLAESTTKELPGKVSAQPWDMERIQGKTLNQFKVLLGNIFKLSAGQIDPEEPLESYGINSVMITQVNQKLSDVFGELSKTLLFEYQTLGSLAAYFISNYPKECMQWIGLQEQGQAIAEKSSASLDLKNGSTVITSLKSEITEKTRLSEDRAGVWQPIAIIGMSGRYPQASTMTAYWKNLKEGRDCITEISEDRWSLAEFFHPDPNEAIAQGKSYGKWGGFIDDFSCFDPLFFNISPREALNMDPQERLFIESCWEVFEDAGYTREVLLKQYNNRVGIFVGITRTGFNLYGPDLWKNGEQLFPFTCFGSVANRISYLMNLKGPSIPIDTMCSSSLTAVHEACEHLHRQECEMAVAGGVNLYLHPSNYVGLCFQHMLSTDGRCKSFGKGGNGYVPGEGVGSILLKPLSRAIDDGDHIYAVIRGTSINHGGKNNGYTVPNPIAQGELIREAIEKAGINSRTISYIEAHGSGTELGDPIEINGLTYAFRGDTQDTGFCSIGSVKSNIGHLEAAAGIAGIAKIILQMKNRKIVPSLHVKELNPNINFDTTPFVIQKELTEWKLPKIEINGKIREYPRIAGISSFGAGGANAHAVIEEYIPADMERPQAVNRSENPYAIVLSAKDEDKLIEKVRQLLMAIQEGQMFDDSLTSMAYTLQVGREAMQTRLAFMARSIKEVTEKLNAFLKKENTIDEFYQGQVKQNKDTIAVFMADSDLQKAIDAWIMKGKFEKLLDLWVKGLVFDWNKLYGEDKPGRISLPTYPFARERYWIPKTGSIAGCDNHLPEAAFIHPFLQQNTSDLAEHRYSSHFTGQEFFFSDHLIDGQRTLPGIAHLEIARAAADRSVGDLREKSVGIQLKDVLWGCPIFSGKQGKTVHIALHPERDGQVFYEIYSDAGDPETETLVHNQGRAILCPASESPCLDLSALQTQCSQGRLSAIQCYEAFKKMGIDYGPGYQVIEEIYVGQKHALAKLSIPHSITGTKEQFILHPSLMDAAVQAAIGLLNGSNDKKPFVTSALDELSIFSDSTVSKWAYVRYNGKNNNESNARKLDIDLCDEKGRVSVRIKGLEIQNYKERGKSSDNEIADVDIPNTRPPKTQEDFEMMTFEEVWEESSLSDGVPLTMKTIVCFVTDPENQKAIFETIHRLDQRINVIFISQGTFYQKHSPQEYSICSNDRHTYHEAFKNIREENPEIDTVLYMWASEDSKFIRDYSCIVYTLQAISAVKQKVGKFLLAGRFDNQLDRCYLESWIGFERSLGLVFPNTQVAAVFHEYCKDIHTITMQDWIEKILDELNEKKIQSVLYQGGKRYICQIRPTFLLEEKDAMGDIETVIITGGCGGLGFLFAEHFAKKGSFNLVLTGRSSINKAKQRKIEALEKLGSRVMYVQADVCDKARMKEGLKKVAEQFGLVHGIIHAAGIDGQKVIFDKDMKSFQKVLDPKIRGSLVIEEVVQKEALKFVCYFSSSAATLGDFGACDYAIANRFLMAYANYRSQKQLPGRTIVISWPLWRNGGMGVGNEENTEMYLKSSGQKFLETRDGLEVFERILSQKTTQHLVIVGQPSRVNRFLKLTQEPDTRPAPVDIGLSCKGRRKEMKGFDLEQCLIWDIKEYISNIQQIPRSKLSTDESFAEFGFDSISLAQFADLLSNHYGIEITPSLFFGYPAIDKLSRYFLNNHQQVIQDFYEEEAFEEIQPEIVPPVFPALRRQHFEKPRLSVKNKFQGSAESIAIIGMSGRFPQARNIDEMWKILEQGKDTVTEIPLDRFDWRKYFGDPAKDSGKTDCKWCGFLSGVDEFDSLFFEISPREAEKMDPRQRLLLQESYKALEDAGYGHSQIKTNRIGIFVGVEEGDYLQFSGNTGSITSTHNAILASRLSYFLDLNGPTMAINTACSSGLVAVHQACSSLRNEECTTAIAASVNLIFTPENYVSMSQAGMLSKDGKCFAFDKRANGMVPGESVAVVVLKRLSLARKDRDRIYAVIKGSGINNDGKTNGITAPSGVSQSDLLKSVYDRYHVNPEEIQYIVTHGTGTKLGDPIEINALYDAFKEYTKKRKYIALTSTKTNFGHTFAPSGVVSLISLVQAMRHEVIPASLHCEMENDYIQWKESPFFVNKTNKSWPRKQGKRRIGAVSAFGMSGTNAHMVIEDWLEDENDILQQMTCLPCHLLVFSAKTADVLHDRIEDMIEALQTGNFQKQDLQRISCTLMDGRQHFSHRCAIVIQDIEDAIHILKQSRGKEKLPNLFQAKVPQGFNGQKALKQYVQELLGQLSSLRNNKSKYQEVLYALAELYCQGYDFSFDDLYKDIKPRMISLPTYPFVREHYILNKKSSQDRSSAALSVIHPLLHQNTSDLTEQRFTSTFTGKEFFMSDHVFNGRRIFPGMAYLEMARAAVSRAAGVSINNTKQIRFKDVAWASPVISGKDGSQIHIGLHPEKEGQILYEIYSNSRKPIDDPLVHCQGRAVLSSANEVPEVDIESLKAFCSQKILNSRQCYDMFKSAGIQYGPGHKGIDTLYVGSNRVLAELSLSAADVDTQDQFVLHPSLMDSALQASIGLTNGSGIIGPALPVALDELEILGNGAPIKWAVIGYTNGNQAASNIRKIDIDLCNKYGKVCVRMKGFSSRVYRQK